MLDVGAAADRQLRHAERRREVARPEHERLDARDGGDPRALGEPARGLDLRLRGRRKTLELAARLDLRQDDDVGPKLGDEREIVGRAAVDADPDRAGAPVVVAEGARQHLARRVLARGGDRVLEIEDHLVDLEPGRLLELACVVARDGQAAAASAHGHGATLTISVRRGHECRTRVAEGRCMRYLAAAAGVVGTIVLLLPAH